MQSAPPPLSRRRFLAAAAGLALLGPLGKGWGGEGGVALAPMPVTGVGRHGLPISRLCFHGFDFPEVPRDQALPMLERARELGITLFETAASYGRGREGERRLGEVFEGRRSEVVFCTKTQHRGASEAERDLEESLRSLRTGVIDIWQFHGLAEAADFDAITGPGGALETARAALEDGRVRSLGIHGIRSPAVLNLFLDAIGGEIEFAQFPVNCIDPHWNSFIRGTLPKAAERGVAVLGSHDLALDTLELAHKVTPEEARLFTLSQPITSWLPQMRSMEELEECAALVRGYTPLREREREDILERSAIYAGPTFEFYKR